MSKETANNLSITKDFYYRAVTYKILNNKTQKTCLGIRYKYVNDTDLQKYYYKNLQNYNTEMSHNKIEKTSKCESQDYKIMFYMKKINKIIKTYHQRMDDFHEEKIKLNF